MTIPAGFLDDRSRAGVFLDFDGSLSEIVDDPAAARPVTGAGEILEALTKELGLVAVVSGRSAHQLLEWLGPEIEIWGLHGAERTVDGRVEVAETARPYLDTMKRAAEEARSALVQDGIEVEEKGVMVGLHYRRAPEQDSAVSRVLEVAMGLASLYGLEIGIGRMVVELKPPLQFSKGDVVRTRGREASLRAAAFIGDDLVDIPGFHALEELKREGIIIARVAVDSPEAPGALLERADVVVEGPRGVMEWLSLLLD